MRLRLGLGLLFAIVAILPFALAVEWSRAARDATLREAADERADRVADAWRGHVEGVLAGVERAASVLCRAPVEHESAGAVLELPDLGARLVRRGGMRAQATWSATSDARSVEQTVACEDGTSVRASVPIAALLDGPDGPFVASAPGRQDARDGEARRVVRSFPAAPGGGAPVELEVQIPAVPIGARALASLELRSQILALGSVLVAFVAGFLVAGRFTRPLGELERAAERIGRGELDVEIERPSGSAGATFSAFNRMARELRDQKARARRAERVAAWRDIARRIAHEIKNPLTPIRMSIETMRRTKQRQHPDFDEIFDESTRTVLEEVERLERIVTEFSRFARLPRPRPAELDVREVIAQAVQLHSPGGDATITDTSPRLPIKMTLPDALPRVRADRDQLMQVLVNLVQNAIDAAESKRGDEGHVEVAAEPAEDGGVRVTVSDDGPGIPEEERARILEPYYTTKARGTGLGLAIVDRIVSDHGGTLTIGESRRGGAAISFTLTREGPSDEADVSQTS